MVASSSSDIISICLVPIISSLVGYITNVIAVYMTFHPTEFKPLKLWQPEGQPIGFFGWQGIIPAKAVQMAGIMCDVFLERVVDIEKIFGRIDPKKIAELTWPKMKGIVHSTVDAVATQQMPNLWHALSPRVKQEVYQVAADASDSYMALLLKALQGEILDIMNVRTVVTEVVKEDKATLSRTFLEVGANEFKFIRRSGLYFGFLFGLIQMVIYIFYKAAWVLPVAGFFVGYATNWIALKLIFEPARPWRLGPFTLQGLFLRRQQEASVAMAHLCREDYLDQHRLWTEVCYGEKKERWYALLDEVAKELLAQKTQSSVVQRVGIAVLVGEDKLTEIRRQVVDQLKLSIPDMLPLCYDYMDECMAVEDDIRASLQAMPPQEFIGILRPVFQQDELKLIIVGGVLGALAGVFQQFVLFEYI